MNAEQLEQWCMGKDVDEVTDLLKNKYNAKFVDEKIDDGGDEEGTYVKKRVLSINGGYIDLYYLDTDGIISYVDVDTDVIMESKKKKCGVIKINEAQLRGIIAESVKKVLKEYELSDREKGIMRGYWGDVENRRMPKEKYEPYKPQPKKTSSSNSQKPKHWQYDNRQGK